jgi:hypothetical protein
VWSDGDAMHMNEGDKLEESCVWISTNLDVVISSSNANSKQKVPLIPVQFLISYKVGTSDFVMTQKTSQALSDVEKS